MSLLLYASYCVSLAARCRLPADALADLCVARQLYSASHARIKQQRQALLQQLQAVMAQYSSMGQYGCDDVLSNALGEGLRGAACSRGFQYVLEVLWLYRELAAGCCCCLVCPRYPLLHSFAF
jgi:hypothetical protein